MEITSIKFMIFVAEVILLFAVFPKKYKWVSLLLNSILFYLAADWRSLIFVGISSVSVWVAGMALESVKGSEDQRKIAKRRKFILIVTLFINIGILVVLKLCKYMSARNADTVFTRLILPLGISYYTFSVVGYLLDLYWNRYLCEKNYLRFLNWVIYFPHIVQGPISRYDQLGKELKKELSLSYSNFCLGMELVLWGCFKKLVIADRISIYMEKFYAEYWPMMVGSMSLVAMILDAVQIYADFSGYVDIVTGVSQIFGVKLEKNFDRPFMAKTVPEFWRRWHISLGNWFKDYVYYPVSVSGICKTLGKKLRGRLSSTSIRFVITIVPVMCTWILTGLWHGTGIGYLLWGIYYGILMILSVALSEHLKNLWKKCRINTECFSWRMLQRCKVLCVFMGGRLLAREMPFSYKIRMIKSVVRDYLLCFHWWDSRINTLGLNDFNFQIVLMGIICMAAVAVLQDKYKIRETMREQNYIFRLLIPASAFFAVFLFGIYGAEYEIGSFMYQQF